MAKVYPIQESENIKPKWILKTERVSVIGSNGKHWDGLVIVYYCV